MLTAGNIGMCTWSLYRDDPVAGLRAIGNELNLKHAQVGFFGSEALAAADPTAIRAAADEGSIAPAGVFVGFDGGHSSEVSDVQWKQRLEAVGRGAAIAKAVGCASVAIHAGALPSGSSSDAMSRMVEWTRNAARQAGEGGLRLLLETGCESAAALVAFIDQVGAANVGVNFDPANFVIYDSDDPVRAVGKLKKHIGLVHMKDATRPAGGESRGQAAPLGAGEAEIPRVLSKLRIAGYDGPLLIETGGGSSAVEGVRPAIEFLHSMLA